MYKYDSKSKTQSEKSQESASAANKDNEQTKLKMSTQTKSLFIPSFNQENDSEKSSSNYASRLAQLMPLPYSPLQMQLTPKQERREIQPLPLKMNENQEKLAPIPAKPNNTGIPLQMKERFERLSGFSFDDVRVHYNSNKPAQLQALAYTQGNQVHIGQGQEKHLGHELGHVVQQKWGKVSPTTTIGSIPVNDDPVLECEADSMFQRFTAPQTSNPAESGNVVQRYVIVGTTDFTKTYHDQKRGSPGTVEAVLDNTVTAIAKEMLKELNTKHDALPDTARSERDYIAQICNTIINDTGGLLRKQLKKWIRDYAGDKHEGKNPVFGQKFQPRVYNNYCDLAMALTGWVGAKTGRKDEKAVATQVMQDKAISYHLDSVFIKVKAFIAAHARRNEIENEIKNPSVKITHDCDGAVLPPQKDWAVYKPYFDAKTDHRNQLPEYWNVLTIPKNYDVRQKTGVLHDLMHYFSIKFKGDTFFFGGLPEFQATTLTGRQDYIRPESSQIRGDMNAAKTGGTALNLANVKYSHEESHPSYKYARKHKLPMYGRHSYSAARMMGLAKKANATSKEISAVGWAIMAYWRVHYDHTSIPYHTTHEIMDFAPAFGLAYDPTDRFAGLKNIQGDEFLSFLKPQAIAKDLRATDALMAYHQTDFDRARYFLADQSLWHVDRVMGFLQTTVLPTDQFLALSSAQLYAFFQYNQTNKRIFTLLDTSRQRHVNNGKP